MSMDLDWYSQISGWQSRSSPHPAPHSFFPTISSLRIAALRNTPADPEGFTLAIFTDRTVIDAFGRMSVLTERDYAVFLELAGATLTLPHAGRFRNTWVIDHDRTSQAIERLLVANPIVDEDDDGERVMSAVRTIEETSVQGFDKVNRRLKVKVGNLQELPEELWELTGLVLEARSRNGNGTDGLVLARVRDLLRNFF